MDAAVTKVMLRHAIGRVRNYLRQNLRRSLTDSHRASQLHNECANFRMSARNFVNDRQGYRTVKTADSTATSRHVQQATATATSEV